MGSVLGIFSENLSGVQGRPEAQGRRWAFGSFKRRGLLCTALGRDWLRLLSGGGTPLLGNSAGAWGGGICGGRAEGRSACWGRGCASAVGAAVRAVQAVQLSARRRRRRCRLAG